MAALEVIALDTGTPQLRAPGASDTYTFPRAVELPLGTANGVLFLNGSKVVTSGSGLVFDSSGNLGLGVTPSTAWGTSNSQRAFQLGPVGALSSLDAGAGNKQFNLSSNAIDFNSTPTYLLSDFAAAYRMVGSAHQWFTAPSGTAGNAISFTQAMTLDASGRLLIGATTSFSANAKLQVQNNISLETKGTGGKLEIFSFGAVRGGISTPATAGQLYIEATSILSFGTSGNVRASFPALGGFVVGTAALATNATAGFVYVPTCAGTPTGTPTTQTGTAPIVVDTTNNKLYFYSGGQWRDAGP